MKLQTAPLCTKNKVQEINHKTKVQNDKAVITFLLNQMTDYSF